MQKGIIGRRQEKQKLEEILHSKKSEFLVVYGRRRVGKTFLIREFFNYSFHFEVSGLANGKTAQQLLHFYTMLNKQSNQVFQNVPKTWYEAINYLITHLEGVENTAKKIIFIDEMPWFDTRSSDFIMALEYFWNTWASARKDVLLITCGSAASWMINKVINNAGGLHNRATQKMKIEPFTLAEVEQLLKAEDSVLDRFQIVQLYMALGGIPYYLSAVKPNLSAAKNIQMLFFDKNGILKNEFFNLYRSLFRKYQFYEKIVEKLSTKTAGFLRSELAQSADLKSGGTLTKALLELEESGFISSCPDLGKKTANKLYRLSDYYTAFYFKFIKNAAINEKDAWLNLVDHPSIRAWQGYAFEQICISHVDQIKKAMQIGGVASSQNTWRGSTESKSCQIDLLIDRRDQVINICECKFSINTFEIDTKYAEVIRDKIGVFKQLSNTKKAVFFTMITTFGIAKNKYASLVQSEVTLDQLFAD